MPDGGVSFATLGVVGSIIIGVITTVGGFYRWITRTHSSIRDEALTAVKSETAARHAEGKELWDALKHEVDERIGGDRVLHGRVESQDDKFMARGEIEAKFGQLVAAISGIHEDSKATNRRLDQMNTIMMEVHRFLGPGAANKAKNTDGD